MEKRQTNIINMYQATNLILTAPANAPVWANLPAFTRGQTRLTGSLNILNALVQSQQTALSGIAVDKDRLKQSVIARVLIVAGAGGGYAFEANNATLSARFDTAQGRLENLPDIQLDDIAQGIHDEALALITAQAPTLAEYGLTPAVLDDLQSAITAYGAAVGTPRAAISSRTAVTAAIAAEIRRASATLNELLDRLMLQYRADHSAFYDAYQSARKIVDLGTPTTPTPPTP